MNMDNATSTQNNETKAVLEALLASQASPEDFARQLFVLTYERTKTRDPELAEMLRACAIPRSFNAQLIGVLRDQMEDTEANQRLLSDLLTFSFVLTVPGSSDFTS